MIFVGHVITFGLAVAVTLLFRRLDQNNRSIEKAKKYGDQIRANLEAFVKEKEDVLQNYTNDFETKRKVAVAAVNRLDGIYEEFNQGAEGLQIQMEKMQEIQGYISRADQAITQLTDMAVLAEKNITDVTAQSEIAEDIGRNIMTARNDISELSQTIPDLRERFVDEGRIELESIKEHITDTLGDRLSEIDGEISKAKKDSADLLDGARIALNNLYKETFAEASKKADTLETTVLEKLKGQSEARIQKYRDVLQERSALLEKEIKENLKDTKMQTQAFKTQWETQAKEYMHTLKNDFTQTQNVIHQRSEALKAQVKNIEETVHNQINTVEESITTASKSFAQKLTEKEREFSTAIEKTAGQVDGKFSEYKKQSDDRFSAFEKTLGEIDTLDADLQESLEHAQKKSEQNFLRYVEDQKKKQTEFINEFMQHNTKVTKQMQQLEHGLNELKTQAYQNTSEKLKLLEDEFFADLKKERESLNEKMQQWETAVKQQLVALANKQEKAREAIEKKYTDELGQRIALQVENFKKHSSGLNNKMQELEQNLQKRIQANNTALENSTEEFKAEIARTANTTKTELKKELDQYKNDLHESIKKQYDQTKQNTQGIHNELEKTQQKTTAQIDAVNNEIAQWKAKTDRQFTDARTLFDDKITSFESLTTAAIENLNTAYQTQYREFIKSTVSDFDKLNKKIDELKDSSATAQTDLEQYIQSAKDSITKEQQGAAALLTNKIEKSTAEANRVVASVDSVIKNVHEEIELTKTHAFEKIDSDTHRLEAVLAEMEKKQQAFINETKIFDRADELKKDLEQKIEKLKNEVTRFEVYRKAIDELSLQYEKVTHLEKEASEKISRFMSDRKHIDLLEAEFAKLTALSESMDKKVLELTAVNDDLQQYQVQIRKIEQSISTTNSQYDRLEKKGEVLAQTVQAIDTAFENLNSLETTINTCQNDINVIPNEIEKIQHVLSQLSGNKKHTDEVYTKLEQMDGLISEMDKRMATLQNAREWLAATETRLQELSKETQERLKLLNDLTKAEKSSKKDSATVSITDRANVLKLSEQGWKVEEIANALNLSYGEVELILELAEK